MNTFLVPSVLDNRFGFVFRILDNYLKVILKVVEQLVLHRVSLYRQMESILLFLREVLYGFKSNDFTRMNLALSKGKQEHNLSLVSVD